MAGHGENLAAIILSRQARLVTDVRPVPTPGPDELLVRNRSIAANPADWKIQEYELFIESYPAVLGSDVCGEVVSVGSEVRRFKPGDRVTGFAAVVYNSKPDHGAWQTYTLLRELAASRIPDSMSFETGSIFPMAVATAAIALFVNLEIPRTPSHEQDSILLVWGAGSSVGSAAVQLGKWLGFEVFGTASRSNFGWLKEIGAQQLFDYHDKDVEEQIVTAAKKSGKPIKLAFDPISEGSTFDQVTAIVKKSVGSGGKVVDVLPWPEAKPKPDGVDCSLAMAFRTGTDHSELGAWLFNDWLAHALEDGSMKPAPPVEVFTGGLESTQELFDKLKAGVSGKKLVMKIA